MAASPSTITGPGLRCPVHHCPSAHCAPADAELSDTLAELQRDGVLIVNVEPTPLGYCTAFTDCLTEQAVVTIRTVTPEPRGATFTVVHETCLGCLDAAVRWDRKRGHLVEVHVPAHAIEVSA
jgi:hypothetical protein